MPADTPRHPTTIDDVARAAGVSKATVSRVVNNLRTVDPTIAERVREAVARLNYAPNSSARSLASGVTKTIGVIVPDLENPMFQQILAGVNAAAAVDGYCVLVGDSRESVEEEARLAMRTRARTDAIVLCAPRSGSVELRKLTKRLSPVVVVNRIPEETIEAPLVTVDYQGGIQTLAHHLMLLGHRDVLYLSGPSNSSSNAERLIGLHAFIADHPEVRLRTVSCGSSMEDGYQAWDGVSDSGATAVLAFNDVVALGLLGRLHEAGVAVPSQLSVTGFDNVQMGRFSTPPLTTMAVRQQSVGSAAWRQLRDLLAGEPARPTSVFRPELVVRQSTGPRG